MRVCFTCTLFWLVHLSILALSNGADVEEGYKPRRWSAAGEGPYRLVVSSESETLAGEESVSLAVAQEKKKKEKAGEEVLTEKYDKVTQRMVLKQRGRKRAGPGPEGRKRRRNPSAPTTGQPQTMSYNLYNHFRPLETDLPRESLLPFLDFGRKLSTPSGANSIEGSSTPRGEPPPPEPPDEDVFAEEMDVAVVSKAVERNSVPRGPAQMRHDSLPFLRRNSTQLLPVHSKPVVLETRNGSYDHKTDKKDVHYDLQSNESGINLHSVLSPNYGLKLNKTEANSDENSTKNSISSDPKKPTGESDASDETTEKFLPEIAELKLRDPTVNASKPSTNDTQPQETEDRSAPSPKPTARILSTAVVTSVSVKESPWLPRIKTNLTRPEIYQRLVLKNATADAVNSTSNLNLEGRLRGDNHTIISQQNMRRKMYTTLRPKTTTYRPVTFRSVFRRNFTGLGAGVVHILSTPPTYIEVPKILAKTSARIVSSEALLASVSPGELSEANLNATSVKPEPSSLPTTYPEPKQTAMQRAISKLTTPSPPSTQSSTTVSTSSSTTPSTTSSTTVPTTTTSTTTTTTTTTTALPTTAEPDTISTSTSKRPLETVIINQQTDSGLTEIPETTDVADSDASSDDELMEPENATVEIEFKPLDIHTISTTETFNASFVHRSSRPFNQRNHSIDRTASVGVAYPDSHLGLVTYVLAGLALIPLILGLSVLARQIFKKSKKKVLDESEYSSEYNRTPLPTKLPRVPAHINWEGEKTIIQSTPPIPVTKWEFSRDKLRLQTVLGQGNFGQVWKAEADDLSGHEGNTRLVAVKTVKEGSTLREKEDLLRELGIMQELGAHPNVVTLIGCCTEKEPYLLIMEYVMYGKLLAFLREHRTRAHYFNFSDLSSALTSRDLTFFSYCVARGMEYLVTKGIIHRDLAARNILVDHTKLCKIADFGMSRNVRDTGQIYEQRPNRGALPIRWMAPESLHLSLFTHKSDVWSYGILLWEIITLGSTPYNKMGAREVMRQVRDGYRLEKPKHCRSDFYKVVSKCWHSDPAKRPSFTELKQDLATLLADEKTNGEYVDLDALTEEMCDQSS